MPGGMLLAVLVLTSFNENAPGGNAFGVGGDTAGLMSSRAKAAVASPTHCSRSSCVTLKRTCADVPFSLFMPVASTRTGEVPLLQCPLIGGVMQKKKVKRV